MFRALCLIIPADTLWAVWFCITWMQLGTTGTAVMELTVDNILPVLQDKALAHLWYAWNHLRVSWNQHLEAKHSMQRQSLFTFCVVKPGHNFLCTVSQLAKLVIKPSASLLLKWDLLLLREVKHPSSFGPAKIIPSAGLILNLPPVPCLLVSI